MNCKQHSGVQPYEENVTLAELLGTQVQYVVRDAERNSFIFLLLLSLQTPALKRCMDEPTDSH